MIGLKVWKINVKFKIKKIYEKNVSNSIFIPCCFIFKKWTEDLKPSKNFYEIQEEFNKYWEKKPYEKGKGWKQFKRWENFIEKRVYPDGEMKFQRYFMRNI